MGIQHSICPWWLGYLLASPVRKWLHDPERILRPYVREGMTALDVGCAMGFFTLPMARLVGPTGKVVAVDVQEKMIRSLRKRAIRAGLDGRIESSVCNGQSLGLDDLAGQIDFVLAFAVIHEIPDVKGAMESIVYSLKPGGEVLIAEPTGHVGRPAFDATVGIAASCGLSVVEAPSIKRSQTALMRKS